MVSVGRLILLLSVVLGLSSASAVSQEGAAPPPAAPATPATAPAEQTDVADTRPAIPADQPTPAADAPAPTQPAPTQPATEQPAPAADPPPATAAPAADAANKDKDKDKDKDAAEDKDAKQAEVEIRVIALSGNYVDLVQPMGIDASSLLLGSAPGKQKSFYRLCTYLEELAKETELKYVVFDLSDARLAINSAQLDELTRYLKKLTDAQKKTIAWLEDASNEHLAIAAACDQVIMADFGGIDMPSASMESMFYRDAMDLIGIKASIVRAGDFKGAVEPYLNPVMSQHLREHYLEMLKSINDARISRIAAGRGLKTDEVRALQSKRILLPKDALAAGLVDQLAPYGAMRETVNKIVGQPTKWTTPKTKAKKDVSFFELMGMIMSGPDTSSNRIREDSIAVLHLSGPIVDGTSSAAGSIVSGPTIKTIEALGKEDKIKGVVVRINSPGGSATASEAIRQSLLQLVKQKPTVVSMGEIAGSGGYWVSCIDAPVFAERGTITGSIGVFSMKFSFGSLLRRVGVHVESLTLDDAAAFTSIDRSWSDDDVAKLQAMIDHVYDRFLGLVADSRGMPIDQVRALAGGRVWSGTQAKSNGLVDELGGLDNCLQVVAKKAKLEKYKVIHRPEGSSGLNLAELFGQSDDDAISVADLSRDVLDVLRQRGFKFDTTLLLIQDAVGHSPQRPTVWLLNPAEISVR